MLRIQCPHCGETDSEIIIIVDEGKTLKCDSCGKLFDLSTQCRSHTPTLPGGYGVSPKESVGGWGA